MVMNAAQAAERVGVRPSTVSRWVQSGRLAAGRLPTGELQIEDGVLDEFLALRTASPRSGPDATVELAVAQERIRGLEAHSARGSRSLRRGCRWSFRLSHRQSQLGGPGGGGGEGEGHSAFPGPVRLRPNAAARSAAVGSGPKEIPPWCRLMSARWRDTSRRTRPRDLS